MKVRALVSCGSVSLIVTFFSMSFSWLAAGLAAGGGQGSQPARQKIDVSRLGPQVGQRVPDFSLTDQNGHTRNLQ